MNIGSFDRRNAQPRKLRLKLRNNLQIPSKRSSSTKTVNSTQSGNTLITRQSIRTEFENRSTYQRKKSSGNIDQSEEERKLTPQTSFTYVDEQQVQEANFKKKKNLEEISEVHEEFGQLVAHIKQAWFYFFMICFRFVNLSFEKFFFLIAQIIILIYTIFLYIMKAIIYLCIQLYFFIDRFQKVTKLSPFINSAKIENLNTIQLSRKNQLALFLDLDQTLIYSSQTKPDKKKKFHVLTLQQLDEEDVIYYVQLRPYLEEFLDCAAQYFRLFVITTASMSYAQSALHLFQKGQLIEKVFARRDLVRVDGKNCKSIAQAYVDLKSSIILDNSSDLIIEKDNFVKIKNFRGEEDDEEFKKIAELIKKHFQETKDNDNKFEDFKKNLEKILN